MQSRIKETDGWKLAESLAVAAISARALPHATLRGRVVAAHGLAADILGFSPPLPVGARFTLLSGTGPVPAELVAVRPGAARAMLFGAPDGIALGTPAIAHLPAALSPAALHPHDAWLGRVITPLGEPADGRGPLPRGPARPVRAPPPPATRRARLGPPLDLGVAALNAFTPCREGQRLGLFAGSGIGKSTLLGMLARFTAADMAVLALVGERGREVRDFVEDELGAEGLARAVVIAATSDAAPLMRREAAYTALTVAEHFRDQGRSVLLLMDSVTRFCAALREIALAAGELPATRGYPPSVWAELPRLLERAGPGPACPDGRAGQITGLFTVLVEGSDHEEPVADAVRGILDGHVVLDRAIAEAGRYPAIDLLRSLSRTAGSIWSADEAVLVARARRVLATAADMADLVRLGAYKPGADPAVDEAIRVAPRIEAAMAQGRDHPAGTAMTFAALASCFDA